MAGKNGAYISCNLATAGNWKYRAEIFGLGLVSFPNPPAWLRWLRSQTGFAIRESG